LAPVAAVHEAAGIDAALLVCIDGNILSKGKQIADLCDQR
jgi:hypothetical protein